MLVLVFWVAFVQAQYWSDVQSQLLTQQNLFNSNGFTQYVFSAQRSSCMCWPCSLANKFITVSDGISIDIEFDSTDSNSDGCTENHLYSMDRYTINDWFEYGLNYTRKYMHCNTTKPIAGCTDVSLAIEYDETYNFPVQMIFDQAAMAYDGGMGWNFNCFTPFIDGPSSYTNECEFNPLFTTTTPELSYWETLRSELLVQRDTFISFGFSDYKFSTQRWACECMPCATAKKWVIVRDYNVSEVVFDDNNGLECSTDDLYDADYRTMLDWFNVAIAYTQTYDHCETSSKLAECSDKSLEFTFDSEYGHLSEIVFDKEAMAYDGGSGWNFESFEAYTAMLNTTTMNPDSSQNATASVTTTTTESPVLGNNAFFIQNTWALSVFVVIVFLSYIN